jgi:hypothetical protein
VNVCYWFLRGHKKFSSNLSLKTHITILRHFDDPVSMGVQLHGAVVARGTFKINPLNPELNRIC